MVAHHVRTFQAAIATLTVHLVRSALLVVAASEMFVLGQHSVVAIHCDVVIGSQFIVVTGSTQPSQVKALGRTEEISYMV